jgi:signal transduction histidine kinase
VELIESALLLGRGGAEHHIADSAAPIQDREGNALGVVLVFRDVTAHERKRRLERLLDDATQRLASTLDVSQVLPEVARLVAAEIGQGCTIDVASPEAGGPEAPRPARGALVVPVCSGEGLPARGTLLFPSAAALRDEHVSFARELARRVALALENASLLETTRRALRVRDRFLSMASHELKTPLTSVQLQAETLARRLSRGDVPTPEQMERIAGTTVRQVRRLRALVDDLLDVSRMTAGKLGVRLEPVDLSQVVALELEGRAEELRAAGYAVSARIDPGVAIRGDVQRLEQVVANLVGNAIRYGRGNPIDVELSRDAGAARLVVRDRGVGIDPRDHARIFRAFERAGGEQDVASGLGLGLYIVSEIVAAHGGSVAVESAPGAGSEFAVRFPLGEGC